MPVQASKYDNQEVSRHYQYLLEEAGAKLPLFENHWVRGTGGRHQDEETAPISQTASNLKRVTPWEKRNVRVKDTGVNTEAGVIKDGVGAKSH